MNGEPTRLVDDSSVRDELRERLTREAATPPYKYDYEKGLARLRAAISADSPDAASSPEEDQEANAIRDLASSGRNAEARTRAVRFLERYPDSPLAESVRLTARP